MKIETNTIDWLMNTDSALRWQVLKWVVDEKENIVNTERDKIGKTGWGKKVLDLKQDNGLWNNRLYDEKWISTTYALYLLKLFGFQNNGILDQTITEIIERGNYKDKEIRFSKNQAKRDLAVTGLILSLLCYFNYNGKFTERILNNLLKEQKGNGAWWYDDNENAQEYSNESTLLILEALMHYTTKILEEKEIIKAVEKAETYLLENKAYKKQWNRYAFPNYWFFDYLSFMSYFAYFQRDKDERKRKFVNLIKEKMKNGIMPAYRSHPGKQLIEFTKEDLSKWNTMRAYKVLIWWEKDVIEIATA